MNCQEFETIVNDLAGGRLWDGAKRGSGLAHTAGCDRCAARLANERLLSYELVEVGRHERQVQAPARVKQDLLAAFAAQHATVTPAVQAEVIAFPQPNRNRYWAMAIAAAAIVGLALVIPLRGWFGRADHQAAIDPVAASPVLVNPPQEISTPSGPGKITVADGGMPQAGPVPVALPSRANGRHRAPVRRTNGSGAEGSDQVTANTEITSGFIPLTYLNNATASDGGVILRVAVSRDKLAAMGLPLNLDRYSETIKADIILGDDGVARAIRLVQ